MATIITKNSSTAGAAPVAGDLVQGELAVNVTSKALYTKNASAAVIKLNTPSIVDNGDATAITIDSSENVGIGTSSPAYALDVRSKIAVGGGGSTDGEIWLRRADNTALGQIRWVTASDEFRFLNNNGGIFTWQINGSEKARIDSSGNLLVGTTSTGYTSINAVTIEKSTNGRILISHASGTGSGSYYSGFAYAGSEVGSITQNGTTGVLYNLTSDYRLKNNPQPLTGAKEFVMALQPKKWEWWDGSGEGVGFIAHEFMEVAKYSGHGEKDAVDEEGNIIAQSIQPSSSEVMANLVAFIQELKAELDAAKADIATLKGQ